MASLWDVRDGATAELMQRFYAGCCATAVARGRAARCSDLDGGHPRWSAPYYWAGFVLQGEWR